MGNDNARGEKPLEKTDDDIKINHQRFEHYTYIENQELLEISVDVPEQREIKNWETDVTNSIKGFESQQVLLLPIKHEYQPRGWCGNTGNVKIYYQNFPYLFSEELSNRISMSKHFQEQEIWYLLYSLVSSAKDFAKIQKKIGDVRPYNIFINEEGQIKIANIYSWPYEKTNFDKTAFEKQLTYLAPEEMALIEKGNHENRTNKALSQSFSIGLTLLEVGLLYDVKEIYSLQNSAMNINKLRQKIYEWMNLQFIGDNNILKTYSPLLKYIVASLCQPKVEDREISLTVQEILRPYQNEILNLKQFDKRNIPFNPSQALREYQNQPNQSVKRAPEQFYTPVQPVAQKVYAQPPPIYIQSQPSFNQQQSINNPQQTFTPQIYQQRNEDYAQNTQFIANQTQYRTQPVYQQNFKTNTAYNSVPPVNINIVNGANGYKDIFHKYAAKDFEVNQKANNITIPIQYQAQQFQKYANTNVGQQMQGNNQIAQINYNGYGVPANNSFNIPQKNTFNIPASNSNFTIPSFSNNFTEVNATSQYSNNLNFPQNQYTSYGVQPYPAQNNGSSDFLKKIDQQLQNSRKHFPS